MPGRILVIDDDAATRHLMQAIFSGDGYQVLEAGDLASGLAAVEREVPDTVILDLHLPDGNGIDLLERLHALDPGLPVIMSTAHADVKTAVRAIQLGAFDYLTKPIDDDELSLIVRRALETRALKTEVASLRRQVPSLQSQMGESTAVARVAEQVRSVAPSRFSVLITGESGTGKELVAQAIHQQSDRRERAFVALDCGAIPETLLESELFGHEKGAFTGADRRRAGRFQVAEGGTLFLDEIGNLPIALQAKLLRVLESQEVQAVGATSPTVMNVRFVAATNADLQAQAAAGRFRPDLYYRLAQYTIGLPPLRDRPSDVAHLARRFVREASVELRRPVSALADDALRALEKHPWPGNVRELRNVVRRAVLEAEGDLRASDVQPFLSRASAAKAPARVNALTLKEAAREAARDAERQLISETLRGTRGNKSKAARALETDYKTLHLKMKDLGIRAKDFTP